MSNAEAPEETGHLRLPFDGGRPVLVCGHPGSGKTSLSRHLLSTMPNRPVTVITSSGTTYDVTARRVTVLRPEDETSDAAFYAKAEQVVRAAIATPGQILVIDDYSVLADAYLTEMAEQRAFLDAVEEAITVARARGTRLILVASRVPDRRLRGYFGAQFWNGFATSVDWVIMFGQAPQIDSPALRGAGVMGIDGTLETFTFPQPPDVADQGGRVAGAMGVALNSAVSSAVSSAISGALRGGIAARFRR